MNNFILSVLDLPKTRSQLRAEGKISSADPLPSKHENEVENDEHKSDMSYPRSSYGVVTTPIRESLDSKSLVKLLSAEKSSQSTSSEHLDEAMATPEASTDQLKHDSAIKFLACETDQDISFTPALQESDEVDIISDIDSLPSKAIEYSVRFPPGPMGLELEVILSIFLSRSCLDNLINAACNYIL